MGYFLSSLCPIIFWEFGSDYVIGKSSDYEVASSDYVICTGIT